MCLLFDTTIIRMRTLIIKSLPTSLYRGEEYSPSLEKRGKGRFFINNPFFMNFLLGALLTAVLCAGCSGKDEETAPLQISPEKDIHELYRKVAKEREKTAARAAREPKEDEALRKKNMDAADACLKKYTVCLEACNGNSCEEKCLAALTVCEKDLPRNLKTVKE
jgi:hypothetical protein